MPKKKEEEYASISCQKCGNKMSPAEVRAYREGLYGIDIKKDKRQWCFKCKHPLAGSRGERIKRA